MSNYRLTIVESGSGEEFTVGLYPTLDECSEALEELDKRHEKWCAAGFPKLSPDDLLNHYEGCDAYAVDCEGDVFVETGSGTWESESDD
jgi:hypothetical protein